ncbi:hypothetical protein [Leifsonia sp. LS-T14]|uniref:hypothetical protein n=1 Tax=unclassified Leifsonia TaxID=2663824 RepID=UPI0035A59C40
MAVNRTRLRRTRFVGMVCVALALAATFVGVSFSQPAQALSGSQFDPANIISDANFYDANAMSQAQIQAFLNANVSCQNGNCLAVARTDTSSRSADAMCGAYSGAASELTSTIIFKVQQACGISARVLLVTLQKEQALITNPAPSSSKLDRAMGYACPDNTATPGWCDPAYGGLYNQIYLAAWQFKRYGNPPGTSNFFTWFPVGSPSAVQYNPNAGCGSSTITIANKATAALYYYTPYQPNAAALANLGGTGDGCSAYGNRNFWVFYNNWFGPTTLPAGTPYGSLQSVTTRYNTITLTGWAVDINAPTQNLSIAIQIDSNWAALVADQPNAASGNVVAGSGSNHGFSGSVTASPGVHTLCVTALNVGQGGDLPYGCQTVTVPDASPAGALQTVAPGPASISVAGWAVDPDALTSPVVLDVQVDGQWYVWNANQASTDAANTYPGAGGSHGFNQKVPATIGSHTVCVYMRNINTGSAASLGCKAVVVPDSPGQGAVYSVAATPGGITLSGWAVDPDAVTAKLNVDVQINSNWYSLTANKASADGEAQFPGAGNSHGFSGSFPAANGSNTVCLYIKNSTAGGPDGALGCRVLNITNGTPGGPPQGSVTASAVAGGISLAGWAVDPDVLTQPVKIDIQLDSQWLLWTADGSSPNTGTAFPGAGTNHGFSGVAPAGVGTHTVCVYMQNVGIGAETSLGCSSVTVTKAAPGGPPQGAVTVAPVSGGVSVAGWAVDPDVLTQAVKVDVQVDSTWALLTANGPSANTEAAFPGAGTSHGFSGTVPIGPGAHTVCVYLQNVGLGSATSLGCKAVTVAAPVGGPPQGAVTVSAAPGAVSLSGWAVDPDILTQPVKVDVQVDSTWALLTADQPSSNTESVFPGSGGSHGFTGSVPIGVGAHTVCVYLQNVGAGTATSLGCRSITVTQPAANGNPQGAVTVTGATGGVTLAGWAVDPDILTQPVKVDVQVDSQWLLWNADQASSNTEAAFPGSGSSHGFGGTVPTAAGAHTVCVYLQNVGNGSATSLGCHPVTSK